MNFKASVTVPTASVTIAAPSLTVKAPSVAIGGNIGMNASAGIGGNASVSIAAPSLKIEAPKISMPSMSLGVNVAAPSLSVGVSGGLTTWSGYYEQGGNKYDMALDMTVGNGRIVG